MASEKATKVFEAMAGPCDYIAERYRCGQPSAATCVHDKFSPTRRRFCEKHARAFGGFKGIVIHYDRETK